MREFVANYAQTDSITQCCANDTYNVAPFSTQRVLFPKINQSGNAQETNKSACELPG